MHKLKNFVADLFGLFAWIIALNLNSVLQYAN